MKSISKRLLVISFIFALIAAGSIYYYLLSLDNKEEADEEKTKILVANQDIMPRTKIEKNMVKEIEISADSDYGDFINKTSDIVGKYSREAIFKDERFHRGNFYNNDAKELSAKITGDHRAMAIYVDGSSGVADMIKSGDYVDIFVYLPELKEANRIVRPNLSKLILQNIEVLAIDKDINGEVSRSEIPENYYVTLSVPIVEAEKLVLAEDIGELKLALRPLDKDYIYETDGTIWEEILLDDKNQMKDLFPQYEIKPKDNLDVAGNYNYDKYYYYTIKYGDTLRKISTNFYGKPDNYLLIKEVNKIDDENSIVSGTALKIPVLDE